MHKLILSFKGRILKVYTPKEVEFTIGRHPECDMHIDNLAVEPIHAKIHFKNHKAVINIPSKDFKVLVNNKLLNTDDSTILERGDEIQIGKHTISYLWESELNQDDTTPVSQPRKQNNLNGWLQITKGPRLGRTLHLNNPQISLGPHGKKGVLITSTIEGYFLAHLDNSLNVSVNNQDIGDNRIHLENGHTIQVGDMEMLFYTQD